MLPASDLAAMADKYLPQLPDLETETQESFTWEITNWFSLPQRALSPAFKVGNFEWRLLLFPEGNGPSCRGSISLYLQVLDPSVVKTDTESSGIGAEAPSSSQTWHVCAQFALAMWNPNSPEVYTCQQAHHRYTKRCMDWGYSTLTDLRSAMTRGTKPAAIIEAGKVNITVYLRVLSDPTGNLWHDFVDYDSKQETGYIGLTNQGATCYLNSLLQSLYFTKVFRRAVYQIPEGSDDEAVAPALQRLFYLLTTATQQVDTNTLTTAFGWDNADAFTQHDVQELNRVLMDRLEAKMKGTPVDNFLSKIFVGQMKSFIKCINVDFESSRVEDFWDIQLNVKDMHDIYDSFKEYVRMETLEGENQYHAMEYGLQDANKGVIFESFPPVLHLQLKRYDYDFMRDMEVKINDRYEFPMDLDLEEFLNPESQAAKEAAANGESWEYALHGVLVHSGDLNVGHYYALIKPEAEGDWFRFDDDRVTKATQREVLEENFGGESLHGRGAKRITSAYMLVYVRKAKLDFVLPKSEDTLPTDLPAKIEEEIKAERQKRLEAIEQRQFVSVGLLSQRQFSHHTGVGLAPWAASHDVKNSDLLPEQIKLRRTVKIGELPGVIATHLGVDFQPSLWIVISKEFTARRLHRLDRQTYSHTLDELCNWVQGVPRVIWVQESPGDPAKETLIFVKEFNPAKDYLRGVSTVWLTSHLPLSEAMAQYSTSRKYYVESAGSVKQLNPTTAVKDQLTTGDILVIQTTTVGNYPPIEQFYDFLRSQVTFHLYRNSSDGDELSGLTENKPLIFTASCSKSYQALASEVGKLVEAPAENLQLDIVVNDYTSMRSTLRSDGSNLRKLVELEQPVTLHYTVLSRPLAEVENLVELPFLWVSHGGIESEETAVYISRDALIGDLLTEVAKLRKSDCSKLKAWASRDGRSSQVLSTTMPVERVFAALDGAEFYVGLMSDDEIAFYKGLSTRTKLVNVYHFQKDSFRTHSVPFQLPLAEESVGETKKRLQAVLGLGNKAFEKIKVAVCSADAAPRYLTDDSEILFDSMAEHEFLGLDHPDKRRFGAQQHAITIK